MSRMDRKEKEQRSDLGGLDRDDLGDQPLGDIVPVFFSVGILSPFFRVESDPGTGGVEREFTPIKSPVFRVAGPGGLGRTVGRHHHEVPAAKAREHHDALVFGETLGGDFFRGLPLVELWEERRPAEIRIVQVLHELRPSFLHGGYGQFVAERRTHSKTLELLASHVELAVIEMDPEPKNLADAVGGRHGDVDAVLRQVENQTFVAPALHLLKRYIPAKRPLIGGQVIPGLLQADAIQRDQVLRALVSDKGLKQVVGTMDRRASELHQKRTILLEARLDFRILPPASAKPHGHPMIESFETTDVFPELRNLDLKHDCSPFS